MEHEYEVETPIRRYKYLISGDGGFLLFEGRNIPLSPIISPRIVPNLPIIIYKTPEHELETPIRRFDYSC